MDATKILLLRMVLICAHFDRRVMCTDGKYEGGEHAANTQSFIAMSEVYGDESNSPSIQETTETSITTADNAQETSTFNVPGVTDKSRTTEASITTAGNAQETTLSNVPRVNDTAATTETRLTTMNDAPESVPSKVPRVSDNSATTKASITITDNAQETATYNVNCVTDPVATTTTEHDKEAASSNVPGVSDNTAATKPSITTTDYAQETTTFNVPGVIYPVTTTTEASSVSPFNLYGDFGDNFDPWLYGNAVSIYVTVDDLLQKNETLHFLATFSNVEQQNIVRQQLRNCPYTPLCGFSFNVTIDIFGLVSCCRNCSCEQNCMHNRTCCPDMVLINPPDRELKLEKSCTRMHIKKKDPTHFKQNGALIYAHCPQDSASIFESNCTREYAEDITKFDDLLPVRRTKSNTTFRNKYCALCNHVDESELAFWSPIFRCTSMENMRLSSEEDYIRAAFTNEQCDIKFYSDYSKSDECDLIISTCNETGQWREFNQTTARACSMYSSVITHAHELYQNVYCLQCNGYWLSNTECEENYFDPSYGFITTNDFAFSGLLRFDRDEQDYGKIDSCAEDYLWDEHTRQCRQYYCSGIRLPRNGNCVKLYESLFSVKYVIYMRLIPEEQVRIVEAHLMADLILPWLEGYLFDAFSNASSICRAQILYKSDMTFNDHLDPSSLAESTMLYFDVRFEVYIPKLHDPEFVLSSFIGTQSTNLYLKTREAVVNINHRRVHVKDKSYTFKPHIRDDQRNIYDEMSQTSWTAFTNSEIPITTPVFFEALTPYAFADAVDKLTLLPHYRMNDQYSVCFIRASKSKLLTFRPCTMFNISKIEFIWEDVATGITFPSSGLALGSSDFYFASEYHPYHIVICTDTYVKLVRGLQSKSMSTESILSFICVSVSIVCLLITLLTFCIFSELRTLPGKNTMALTISLLVAQLLYLIGNHGNFKQGSSACKIVGMAIHFFWLLSIFWMNVCSFHTFKVFVRNKTVSSSPGWKTYILYHTYATIASVAFVAINIAVSLVHSDSQDVGYGGSICFISTDKMQEFTFVMPAAAAICSNFIMFIVVIVKIKRMPEVPSNVKHERNNVVVLAKLSTLTGVTWIFGFLYSWSALPIFSYLFIILCGGQGAFLMLSFIVNQRVWKMYKQPIKDRFTTLSSLDTSTYVDEISHV